MRIIHALFSAGIDLLNGFSRKRFHRCFRDFHIFCRMLIQEERLKERRRALLQELTHGVQISGEDQRCREESLSVLSFTLAEQLLQPLAKICRIRIKELKHFNSFSRIIHRLAQNCVIQTVAVKHLFMRKFCSAFQKAVNIDSRRCDRKKSDRSQNGISAADIQRKVKDRTSFSGRRVKQVIGTVFSDDIRSCRCFLFSVFFQHILFENSIRGQGFRCRSGLGNHANAQIFSFNFLQEFLNIAGAEMVSGKQHFCPAAFRLQQINDCFCAHKGSADTQNQKIITGLPDPVRRVFHFLQLLRIQVGRAFHPAGKIKILRPDLLQNLMGLISSFCDFRLRNSRIL